MSVGNLFAPMLMLALIAGVAFWLRRISRGSGRYGRARTLPLEVVDRIAVAPKQGIAIVRVGERAVLVSVGDGGVRSLLELTAEECAQLPNRNDARGGTILPLTMFAAARRGVASAARRTALLVTIGCTALLQAPSRTAAEAPVDSAAVMQQTPVQAPASAQASAPAPAAAPRISVQLGNDSNSGLRVSGAVGSVIMIGLLAMLPALLLLMTSFTRILIVLHFLRQALGTQTAPPAQLLAALALMLTGFVMAPTLERVNREALQPWMNGEIAEGQMLKQAVTPLRAFMLEQTPDRDLARFVEMSGEAAPASVDEVSLPVLVTAFATSELRAAFQMGFAIFLPFVVIDLVVSAVLTSMGMFMLPPTMIALPCKLLLFVLADGWGLIVQSLVASFR